MNLHRQRQEKLHQHGSEDIHGKKQHRDFQESELLGLMTEFFCTGG